MTGKTLRHYRIIAELGRSGMGVVYKAEDARLERLVAFQLRQECHVYSTRSNKITKTP